MDIEKVMQTLLTDIELDIQDLKCVMQAVEQDGNPALREVARRNIRQMQDRLNNLERLLDETTTAATVETATETEVVPTVQPTPILAERIRPATDLRHAISLNDAFRFTRELFRGDGVRMNEVMKQLGNTATLDEALRIFYSTVMPDEGNEATDDFIELLKKYFS